MTAKAKIFLLLLSLLMVSVPVEAADIDHSSAPDDMSVPLTVFVPSASQTSALNYQTAANQILDILTFRYSDDKGLVSYPELFNALGALAGYGCQQAVRESFVKTGIIKEDIAFYMYETASRKRYFLSKLVDTEMVGSDRVKTSVYSLVASAAQEAGAQSLPDTKEISDYNLKTMGTPDFGVARVTAKYKKMETPFEILTRNWIPMQAIMEVNKVDPKLWGWTFALAAHDVIAKHPRGLDPALAAEILMETAIPMSTIDPDSLILVKRK